LRSRTLDEDEFGTVASVKDDREADGRRLGNECRNIIAEAAAAIAPPGSESSQREHPLPVRSGQPKGEKHAR
jgi:hypothetical protein